MALLLGVFAVLVTPREEEPQINVTMANVLIAFPGASSADVQNMVARPAEQVLSQIAGIEHTYSVARPGMAVMTVQFKVGVPRTEALVRLYDVLNANQDWLPRRPGHAAADRQAQGHRRRAGAGRHAVEPRRAPARSELERVAHAMEAELKRVPGTREVQTIGGPGRAVQVTLQPERLRERGVDVLRLKQTLAAANQAMPAGTVIDDAGHRRRPLAGRGDRRIPALGRGRGEPRRRRARGQAGLPARSGAASRPAPRSRSVMSGSRRAPAGRRQRRQGRRQPRPAPATRPSR